MLEEKLSQVNKNIPEFKDKKLIEQTILNNYKNDQKINKKKNNKLFLNLKFQVCSIALLLIIISSFILIMVLNDDGSTTLPPDGKTEYEIEQEKRAALYSKRSKNYYDEYLLSKDEDKSEYTEYLIEQNKSHEDNTIVIDIYYKVIIDYKNGSDQEEIVVKHGELVYPEVFSYPGHYFIGWFVEEEKLTRAISITKDTYIYAKWSVKESITIDGDYYEYYESNDGIVIVASKLKEKEVIEIPSKLNELNVVGMENGAFSAYYNTNGMVTKKIVIPDSVKYIGSSVFSFYEVLEEVVFPKELEELFCNAFSYCSNIKKIKISNDAVNFKVINNCLIDKRTNTLVKGCNTSIIPSGIKTIEKYAFAHIKDIKELIIPDSITLIKASAFSSCTGLEKIKLPEDLTYIDESLFYDCINLKEVYIGRNVSSIKQIVFMNCANIEKIIVSSDNPYFITMNNCLVEKETMKLLAGVNINQIPDGIKIIGSNSFYGRVNITSMYIPNTVTEIEEGAFFKCKNLKKVVMENSVKKIGGYVFTDCFSLEEVTLPDEVEYFGSAIFDTCENLKEITLPKGIKKIPSLTFSRCSKLEKIIFNDEFTSVGAHAFSGCSKLEPFDLSNITYIGSNAFAYCKKFEIIDLSSVKEIDTLAFFNCRGLKKIYIPSTVEVIGEKAFEDCRNAVIYCEDVEKKTTWHDNFSGDTICLFGSKEEYEYKDFVFIKNDDGLELVKYYGTDQEVIIPETVNDVPVTVIGEKVFEYKEFNKIMLPDTVTLIKPFAFMNCDKLKSITMPNSLKTIDNYAFYFCESLTEVILNEGLEYLNEGAFASCDIIKIILPSTLKEIDSYVFSPNYHLVEVVKLCKNVKIQSSSGISNAIDIYDSLEYNSCIITDYPDYIFYYHKNEDKVYLIKYSGDDAIITLPCSIKFTYQGISKEMGYYIRDYAFRENTQIVKVSVDSDESILGINKNAFFACYNLTSIVIPASCEFIGNGAFSNCNHLYEVINFSKLNISIGSTGYGYIAFHAKEVITDKKTPSKVVDGNNGFVYYLGDEYYVVGYYGNIENVIFPNNINQKTYKIASNIFRKNKNLKTVTFTNGIISIEEAAFRECINLKEIYIPSSIAFIGKHAFSNSGLQVAVFEDPYNWKVPENGGVNRYQIIDLSNPETNAKYLNLQYHYFVDWIKEQ